MRAKPKFCECSKPATVFHNNYWMCRRCRDLAVAQQYQHKAKTNKGKANA